jgi:hypothetical protein
MSLVMAASARATVRPQLDGVVLVTTRSTITGRYHAHLILPVSVAPGLHRITVVCAHPAGSSTTSDTVTVTVALPRTGASSERDAVVGSFAVLIGVMLVVGARRRALRIA